MQPILEIANETVEAADSIGVVEGVSGGPPATLEKLQGLMAKTGKDRNAHLRKEQLSQGVLNALLRSLGRLVVEQVHCTYQHCILQHTNASRTSNVTVW